MEPIRSKFEESLPRVSFIGSPRIFSEIFQRMFPAKHFMFAFHLDKAFVDGDDLRGEGEMTIASDSEIPLGNISIENILERPAADFDIYFNSVSACRSS